MNEVETTSNGDRPARPDDRRRRIDFDHRQPPTCGGDRVALVSNEREWYQAAAAILPQPALQQAVVDGAGQDLRVYVVHGRIVAAVLRTAAQGVKGYYPAFDMTPPHLISGIVTDRGVFSPFDLHRYFAGGGAGEYDTVV